MTKCSTGRKFRFTIIARQKCGRDGVALEVASSHVRKIA